MPDEQRPVVAVVGRPPVLRRRHHVDDVLLQRLDVEGLERLGVVEVLAHRVGRGECWCSTCRSSWFGHQSWFVRGRVGLGGRGRDRRVLALAADVRHVGLLSGCFVVAAACSRSCSARSVQRSDYQVGAVLSCGGRHRTGPVDGMTARRPGGRALRAGQRMSDRRGGPLTIDAMPLGSPATTSPTWPAWPGSS